MTDLNPTGAVPKDGEPRILNQQIWGHACIVILCCYVQTRPVNRAYILDVQEYNIYKGSNMDKRIICTSREK
jgi:hypothetical protein